MDVRCLVTCKNDNGKLVAYYDMVTEEMVYDDKLIKADELVEFTNQLGQHRFNIKEVNVGRMI